MNYFAFGSNMDQVQLRQRCPSSTVIGPGEAKGYRLVFNVFSSGWNAGAANLVPDPTSSTWGVLFKVTDEDLGELDSFEGHRYQRTMISVAVGSTLVDAWAYLASADSKPIPPSSRYLAQMIRAAEEYRFPEAYLSRLRSEVGRDT